MELKLENGNSKKSELINNYDFLFLGPNPKSNYPVRMENQKCYSYEEVEQCANFIKSKIGDVKPKIAIICGSGLGGLTNSLKDTVKIPYTEIPNFGTSSVVGHAGNLVFGYCSNFPVICMQGRFHSYEGYAPQRCTLPIRIFKLLGVQKLIVTNAAGAVNEKFRSGDLMIIDDHLNLPGFAGLSPLIGPNEDKFGERFLPMHEPYDLKLIDKLESVVKNSSIEGANCRVHKGVYCMLVGPCFETKAELRVLRLFGADCVGMSTVHETIAAVHCGIKVLGISLITNACSESSLSHEEVLEVGKKSASKMQYLITNFIKELEKDEKESKL